MDIQQFVSRRKVFFVAAMIGIAVLVLVIKLRSSPSLLPAQEVGALVNVSNLQQQTIAPTVSGYGHVKPKHIWQAVSEVGGKIVYRHPELYKGRFLPAGTLLLSIDKTDYKIRLAQSQADLLAIDGQLKGKDLEKKNLQLSLKIEQQQLVISNNELQRKQHLVQKKLISLSELDNQRQVNLTQQQKVQDYENRVTLLPNDIAVLQAQRAQIKARADEAKRQLDKTDIYLPFDAQIAEVSVENAQAVSSQQSLITAHGVNLMTVNAQVSLSDMRILMSNIRQENQTISPNAQHLNADTLPITAEIALKGQGFSYQWDAKVTRISESIEQNQATIGIILEIKQDLTNVKHDKPPLFNGMFVTASLRGVPEPQWLVPERAVHENRIYIMDEQDRLQIIPVLPLFRQNNQVAITGELKENLRLISNDLLPAVAGMKLRVVATVEAEL